MDYLAVRVQDPRLKPLADQVQKCGIINALTEHPQQPVMIDIVEKAFDIGLNNITELAELEVEL